MCPYPCPVLSLTHRVCRCCCRLLVARNADPRCDAAPTKNHGQRAVFAREEYLRRRQEAAVVVQLAWRKRAMRVYLSRRFEASGRTRWVMCGGGQTQRRASFCGASCCWHCAARVDQPWGESLKRQHHFNETRLGIFERDNHRGGEGKSPRVAVVSLCFFCGNGGPMSWISPGEGGNDAVPPDKARQNPVVTGMAR